jgi:hypothetical protein
MMTARDVIAKALDNWFYTHDAHPSKLPDQIIAALHSAGYVIIKDRTDPEGGIPGRKI